MTTDEKRHLHVGYVRVYRQVVGDRLAEDAVEKVLRESATKLGFPDALIWRDRPPVDWSTTAWPALGPHEEFWGWMSLTDPEAVTP